MQRWQTRARRWETRAAERRAKRRLRINLEVVEVPKAAPEANDNDDLAPTNPCHETVAGGTAEVSSIERAA